MKVCVHQPNYLPYLGIISKIKNSDAFIFYDVAQYVKDRFDNRNKIKGPNGVFWLTIPLLNKDSFKKRFFEVKLPENDGWQKKHWRSIEVSYCKADYFDSYKDDLKKIYSRKYSFLPEFSGQILKFLLKEFGIAAKFIKSSDLKLDLNLHSTEILIELLQKVNANTYLAGKSGKKYMDVSLFDKAKIALEYQDFVHPVYRQLFGEFAPNLAAVDLLFNEGENSKNFI